MSNPYIIKLLVLSSGERLPILIHKESGLPLLGPLIYALTQLRGRNLATNTIDQALRHIMLFVLFLDKRQIDLAQRLNEGRVLSINEIEDLTNTCKLAVENLITNKRSNIVEIQKNINIKKTRVYLNTQTIANRIRTITDYLSWLLKSHLLKLSIHNVNYASLEKITQLNIEVLKAHIPVTHKHNVIGVREGLEPQIASRLLQVISVTSPENPWLGQFIRVRNELIFNWLYSFGLRRGELLNIRIKDINFQKEEVVIARRADDLTDPRKEQPVVKTRDRILPIPSKIIKLTYDYIIYHRKKFERARKHDFLFIADKTGEPLSLSALNKCFTYLRSAIEDLPQDLSPHILRHTWNDNFSVAMDKNNIPESDEIKMRAFLMGWSEASGTASTYTKRHIRKKANKISLNMQNSFFEKEPTT
ncbi:MAG: tyrosine-based site-specific recombinase [Pseudomonadota bacterium]|jgi:integrase